MCHRGLSFSPHPLVSLLSFVSTEDFPDGLTGILSPSLSLTLFFGGDFKLSGKPSLLLSVLFSGKAMESEKWWWFGHVPSWLLSELVLFTAWHQLSHHQLQKQSTEVLVSNYAPSHASAKRPPPTGETSQWHAWWKHFKISGVLLSSCVTLGKLFNS